MRFDPNSSKFEPYLDKYISRVSYVTKIHKISRSLLLVETRDSQVVIDTRVHEPILGSHPLLTQHPAQEIVDVARINEENYVFATKKNIVQVVDGKVTSLYLGHELKSSHFTALAVAHDSVIYAGTNTADLISLDLNSTRVLSARSFSNRTITEITDIAIAQGRIWAGSNGGLISADLALNEHAHFDTSNSGLSHDFINTVMETDNVLLIGTVSGVDQLNPTSIVAFNERNSQIHNDVSSFSLDNQGNLWVGTYNGLFKLDKGASKHQDTKVLGITLPEERVTALAHSDDRLWIGLENRGIHIFYIKNGVLESLPKAGETDLSVTSILPISIDRTLASTYGQGIWEIENGRVEKIPNDKDESSFIFLHQTVHGDIFAVSERRLYFYDSRRALFRHLDMKYSDLQHSRSLFLSIIEIKSGDLLVGTKNQGILIWKKEDRERGEALLQPFGTDVRSKGETIYSILEDSYDRIWATTANGVMVLSQEGTLLFRLTSLDGLQSDDFNFGAHYKDLDGRFFYGGVRGYNKIDPKTVDVTAASGRLVVTEARSGRGEPLNFFQLSKMETLTIPHDAKYLTLSLGLLDFKNTARNHFKHKLKGFDSDWIDNGTNNKATYTNLPPGDYTFFAKGANAAGIWSDNNVAINIRVLPPWWRTYWAYCFYVLFCLFAVWGGMRIYRTHLLKQEAERRADEMHELADVVRDELQETQEIHDDLAQSAHQHSIATLALIRDIISADQDGAAHTMLKAHLEAMELLERHYCFQDGILAANLHDYIDDLCNLLLPGAAVDPTTITTLNLAGTSLIPASVASPLAIILRELVDNALQHAFASDSAANFIQVTLEIKPSTSSAPDMLECSVQDDGSGMPVGISIETSRTPGLRVVSALCRKLGAQVSLLREPGTQVTIHAPMPQEQL